MTQTDQSTAVEQCDREAAADILDEVSNLLDHVGIGQVADLIREGEYDEHEVVRIAARHRTRALEASQAPESVVVLVKPCPPHQWAFAPTVGSYTCTKCGERRDWNHPAYMETEREYRSPQSAQTEAGEVFEARHCLGMPADCCDFGVISRATGKEVCRVWLRDDAETIAALLNRSTPSRIEAARVDAELLDRAELAWQRFFYPANDCFVGFDKRASVDLELADSLRLVLAAIGREVRTPDGCVPLPIAPTAPAEGDLLAAIEALGAMPEGYCFCSKNRIGDDSKVHEPECADLRAAILKAGGRSE